MTIYKSEVMQLQTESDVDGIVARLEAGEDGSFFNPRSVRRHKEKGTLKKYVIDCHNNWTGFYDCRFSGGVLG